MDVILLEGNLERPVYHLFALVPLTDQYKVDTEIVISKNLIKGMFGLVKKLDRFFKARNPVLRATKKPVCSGHIGVKFTEHERSRITADDLNAKLKTLYRFLAVAFLMVGIRDLAVGLGHAEPVAVFAKMLKGFLGEIAADRIFTQLTVNASEGNINSAGEMP